MAWLQREQLRSLARLGNPDSPRSLGKVSSRAIPAPPLREAQLASRTRSAQPKAFRLFWVPIQFYL